MIGVSKKCKKLLLSFNEGSVKTFVMLQTIFIFQINAVLFNFLLLFDHTEDCSNDAGNLALIAGIICILKYMQDDHRYFKL